MNPVVLQALEIRTSLATLYRKAGRRGRTGGCRPRSGTILIVVLVCLVAATTILFGAIEVSFRHRRQLRAELQLEQTYWLLDAGIGTAIEKFKQAPDFDKYAFETGVSLKDFTGSVDIKVVERNEESVSLQVTAKLKGPHKLSPITQRSRVIVLDRLQSNQNGTSKNKSDEERNDAKKN